MSESIRHVGICGTFDLENYGDLLFPLIAKAELTARLGHVALRPFSYHARTAPEWPYDVTSVTELPRLIPSLDALLIGGGFLARFDKEIAPSYAPATRAIHHPTGYWLTPALLALQHNVPVIWNAPGMHCNEIPVWAEPLLRLVFNHSRYLSVRDEPTAAALSAFSNRSITVVPDTGFGVHRLLGSSPSAAFIELRRHCGFEGPYVVVQATEGMDGFVRFVQSHAERFRVLRWLALPIGPALCERAACVAGLPNVVGLGGWPDPLLLAECLSQADAVVGHSYHLMITASVAGVPVFTRQRLDVGKYTALQHLEIHAMPASGTDDPEAFLSRLGRRPRGETAAAIDASLAEHWDQVASIVSAGRTCTSRAAGEFWQGLPGILEAEAARVGDARAEAARESRSREADARHARSREAELSADLQRVYQSRSWRATAPLRGVRRWLRKFSGDHS